MKIRTSIVLFFLAFIATSLPAQNVWSLEKCVEHAQENNITVKQRNLSVENAKINYKESTRAWHPNANFGGSFGVNLGRSIDPTTNSFDTQTSSFNGWQLSTRAPIYQGGRIKNTIKQNKINLEASTYDTEQTLRDISLNVATQYLNILFAGENLVIAENRLKLSKNQLAQTETLIRVGSVPAANRYDLEAQIARDEQNLTASLNSLDIAYLALKQSLFLDPDYDLSIERMELDIPVENLNNLNLTEVYNIAQQNEASLKAGKLREESAVVGIEISKAARRPSIDLSANLSTNYSSLAKEVVSIESGFQDIPISFMGTTTTIGFPSSTPVFQDQKYFDQVNQNLGGGISASLSIPIYNRGVVKNNIERSRLNVESVKLQNEQLRQQLKTSVQSALANAKAAKRSYESAQKSVNASKIAFGNSEKRYKVGAINSLELTTARNTFDAANSELIRSKYDYIFKLKVVDFYMGKKLAL